MKKSFFQRTYNVNINFIFLGFISFWISIGIRLLKISIRNFHLPALTDLLSFVQNKLSMVEHYTKLLAVLLLIISTILIVTELVKRLINDSVWNYFKSIYQTFRLRQFLRQDEKSESVISIDNQTTVTKVNPILEQFNQTINKCIVDVRNESVTIFLKYPKSQQAQKLLKDMESHIKEEISSRNPDYYFSSPNRDGNKLWFVGNRR